MITIINHIYMSRKLNLCLLIISTQSQNIRANNRALLLIIKDILSK